MQSSSQFEEAQASHDLHMLKMSKRFSKVFAFNVYKLNQVSSSAPFRKHLANFWSPLLLECDSDPALVLQLASEETTKQER